MRAILVAICLGVLPSIAQAQEQPYIVSPDGKYLGTLSTNQFDPNSVSNPFGKYGSQFSPDSINNPFGEYGSQFSNKSPNNPFATQAPIIIAPCSGYCPD